MNIFTTLELENLSYWEPASWEEKKRGVTEHHQNFKFCPSKDSTEETKRAHQLKKYNCIFIHIHWTYVYAIEGYIGKS